MRGEVTLVGEMNPYGGDDYYALYPSPDGCSGHRLCCKILGMTRRAYLDSFVRVNLCYGSWSLVEAKESAAKLLRQDGRIILLGRKVCKAFRVDYIPFSTIRETLLILPHPSGLNRMWSDLGSMLKARMCVKYFYPEIEELIGVVTSGNYQSTSRSET